MATRKRTTRKRAATASPWMKARVRKLANGRLHVHILQNPTAKWYQIVDSTGQVCGEYATKAEATARARQLRAFNKRDPDKRTFKIVVSRVASRDKDVRRQKAWEKFR